MEKVYEYAAAVLAEVKRAIAGKDACITKAFATILAGGHILNGNRYQDFAIFD